MALKKIFLPVILNAIHVSDAKNIFYILSQFEKIFSQPQLTRSFLVRHTRPIVNFLLELFETFTVKRRIFQKSPYISSRGESLILLE